MPGPWIKFEIATPRKPEVFALAELTGLDADAVLGKLVRVWSWFDEQTKNGDASSVTAVTLCDALDDLVRFKGFAEAMKKVGWLNGTSMPNFDRHNSESAKKRALTAERTRQYRERLRDASSVTREDKNRNTTYRRDARTSKASPTSVTARKKSNELAAITKRVIEHLNAKAGTGFDPGGVNGKIIAARIQAGANEDQLKAVIDAKCAEWISDETMKKYLRPGTLFNATKFAQYVGQLGATGKGAPARVPTVMVHVLRRDESGGLAKPSFTFFAEREGFDFEREARRAIKSGTKHLKGARFVVIEVEGMKPQQFDIAALA